MSNVFIPIDRETPFVIPINEWLDDHHLARFIISVLANMDLSAFEDAYSGGGSPAYPPRMMLALIFYGYATGINTSRNLEKATYEQLPMIFIAGNTHPDHNTINTFRKRFLFEMENVFVKILLFAYTQGILKLGNVSLDGTKIHANANKHSGMSWDYANKLEPQLRAEVAKLLQQAENAEVVPGMNVEEEINRRQKQLEKISATKAELVARAQERFELEKAEYEAKLVERAERETARARKCGGRVPKPPEPGPRAKDQMNFTDPDSRIMPVSGGGFEQTYNAQACVEHESRLIVEAHVTQHANDVQELEPSLVKLDGLPTELGHVEHVLADNGYFSESNTARCEQNGCIPMIANRREVHHPSPEARFADPGKAPPAEATPVERMRYRMKTPAGKALYAKRKSTAEPAFGIIKEAMGFRQFLLRGLEAVKGEWTLVCIAYNLKRLCTIAG